MSLTAQQLYDQAASVRSTSGVDPAIIVTIAQTESSLQLSPPFTLGITTQASRGGIGYSGGSLGSSSPYAGSSQPAAFWSYQNGAEAALAFANYIKGYQPALVSRLGDARAFFDPSGPIAQSNYYVPTPGGTSTYAYYSNWLRMAEQWIGVTPGDPGALNTTPAASSVAAGGSGTAPTQALDFGQSLQHVGISVTLIALAFILFIAGIMLLARNR